MSLSTRTWPQYSHRIPGAESTAWSLVNTQMFKVCVLGGGSFVFRYPALDLLELDLQGLKELPNAGPLRKQPASALNL